MLFHVYVIRSEEGRFYIGSTDNIENRLFLHNSKMFKGWTTRYNNWEIVYTESHDTRTKVLTRERQIKKMKGGNQFKELIGWSGNTQVTE